MRFLSALTGIVCLVWAGTSVAHDVGAGTCQLEDWRWWHSGQMMMIEGVVTCVDGEIIIRAYEGAGENRRFIGVTNAFINGHTFSALIVTDDQPRDVHIMYSFAAD